MLSTGSMKPEFSMHFSSDGFAVFHDLGNNRWLEIGNVRTSEPDIEPKTRIIRGRASRLSGGNVYSLLVVPTSNLKIATIRLDDGDSNELEMQIDRHLASINKCEPGTYAFESQLQPEFSDIADIAYAESRLLDDLEEYACEQHFNPVRFVGIPKPGAKIQRIFDLGPTRFAVRNGLGMEKQPQFGELPTIIRSQGSRDSTGSGIRPRDASADKQFGKKHLIGNVATLAALAFLALPIPGSSATETFALGDLELGLEAVTVHQTQLAAAETTNFSSAINPKPPTAGKNRNSREIVLGNQLEATSPDHETIEPQRKRGSWKTSILTRYRTDVDLPSAKAVFDRGFDPTSLNFQELSLEHVVAPAGSEPVFRERVLRSPVSEPVANVANPSLVDDADSVTSETVFNGLGSGNSSGSPVLQDSSSNPLANLDHRPEGRSIDRFSGKKAILSKVNSLIEDNEWLASRTTTDSREAHSDEDARALTQATPSEQPDVETDPTSDSVVVGLDFPTGISASGSEEPKIVVLPLGRPPRRAFTTRSPELANEAEFPDSATNVDQEGSLVAMAFARPKRRPANFFGSVASSDFQDSTANAESLDLVERTGTSLTYLDPDEDNLIGVFGESELLRGLIITKSGDFVNVYQGSGFDGGTVSEITQDSVTYVKNGTSKTIYMNGVDH